jgi:hypothetical protein
MMEALGISETVNFYETIHGAASQKTAIFIFSTVRNSNRICVLPLQADFFAFELLNGHIYLHLDLGSGGVRVKATTRRVDDGVWHEATLRRTGKEGRVTVDGTAADFSTPGKRHHCLVHLRSHIQPGHVRKKRKQKYAKSLNPSRIQGRVVSK